MGVDQHFRESSCLCLQDMFLPLRIDRVDNCTEDEVGTRHSTEENLNVMICLSIVWVKKAEFGGIVCLNLGEPT
jgi:hypothetical protein